MIKLIAFSFVIMFYPCDQGDDGAYVQAMKEACHLLEQAGSPADFKESANRFERIAGVKTESWLPRYHAAYAYIMMAAMEADVSRKDPYLDAAGKHLEAIGELAHEEDEKLALEGFLVMIRMSVDPSRGMEMGPQCGMLLQQAYQLDPENPRAVLMMAQFNFGSADFMGQDTSEACALFDRALALFDAEEQSDRDPFLPAWGKEMGLMMKQPCESSGKSQGE